MVGEPMVRPSAEPQQHKHGLAAVNGHSAGALTGRVSRPVILCGEPLGLGADACPCAGAERLAVSRPVIARGEPLSGAFPR
ncbi:hypothetical protein GCM10028793_41540 [Nocardiopsis oceani]